MVNKMTFLIVMIQQFLFMIIEPEFPQSFNRFISSIVAREVQTDRAKAKLSESSARQLFLALDTSASGTFFLEDLYIFLKKKGVSLSKKQLKFINKYFGFNRCEKLNFQEFQKYFMQIKDPKSSKVEKSSDQIQSLVELVQVVLSGYNEIEEERLKASKDSQELKKCLSKYYQDDVGIITRQLLKQALFTLKLYSRLNCSLLCQYVIGEQGKQISLKQLFLFEGTLSNQILSPIPAVLQNESKQNKKLSLGTTQQETKLPGSFKFKSQSNDILLQIQNIESAIKQKKEIYSQRKKNMEEQSNKSKPVGTLLKRPSVTDLRPSSVQKNQNKVQVCQSIQYKPVHQERPQNQYARQVVMTTTMSRQNSRQKYSFVDTIEEEKETYEPQDLEELLKTRISNKSREQTLSKASSCARLKIQQIERRVMGRVGQRAAASKVQDYVSKAPSRMSSSQLRSRYSSLTRN